ncbi:MAG: proline dehydrogenase family protein [Candidatus Promineifilaceae bacterium]
MSSNSSLTRHSIIPVSLLLVLGTGLVYWFGESWLRHFLLYLSKARWARNLVSNLPPAKVVARRFVAGETIEDAVAVARQLNQRGMHVTMDYLGESVSTIKEAEAARDEILRLFDRIEREKLDATVSVKLSQLGLKIDTGQTFKNVRSLAASASEYGNRLRIDMEESVLVDITLDIYRRLRYDEGFSNVGVVVQSYLYRTEDDVRRLVDEGASVRLCKGAYMEPANVAFPEKQDSDDNFVKLMQIMLSEKARQNGMYLGVATHDEQMVNATRSFVQREGIDAHEFEFQMLYGIRRDLQESLVNEGYQVRVYVPYGTAWYPYFVRRLAERPANLWFFLSNLVRR